MDLLRLILSIAMLVLTIALVIVLLRYKELLNFNQDKYRRMDILGWILMVLLFATTVVSIVWPLLTPVLVGVELPSLEFIPIALLCAATIWLLIALVQYHRSRPIRHAARGIHS